MTIYGTKMGKSKSALNTGKCLAEHCCCRSLVEHWYLCRHLAERSWSRGFGVPSYFGAGSAEHSCFGRCSAEHWCFGKGPAEHSWLGRYLAEDSCFAGLLHCFGRNPGGHSCSVHQRPWSLDKNLVQQSNARKIHDSQLQNYHNEDLEALPFSQQTAFCRKWFKNPLQK